MIKKITVLLLCSVLSVYALEISTATSINYLKLKADQSDIHMSDTVIHVLASDKIAWNNKANPTITIIQELTNNGTITLFPNTPQLLSMLTTNINYTIEFSDTGYVSNRLNYVDVQIEKTNNCTLIWPTNVMGWVSGSEPSWRNGVNWIYFEKRRDTDKWLGVAQ